VTDGARDPKHRRQYWTRILMANAAGALAVTGISGGFAPGVRWSTTFRGLGVSMVYANCIGISMAVIIRRLGERVRDGQGPWAWASLIATMVAITAAGTAVGTVILFAVGIVPRGSFVEWLTGSFEISIITSLIIGVAVTVYEGARGDLEQATRTLREKERAEVEARRLAAEAQLASLESRVNPHFLFNTLNSIAELVHENPAAAERVTSQLASLMRSALDSASAPLPLEQELQLVRSYLEIERVRFGDRLRYRFDIADQAARALVPRLLLQTIVENSVKYAVSPRRGGASIVVRAIAAGERAEITIEDDGPGFDPSRAHAGHGLELVRSRLAMTFGDRGTLAINSRSGHTSVSVSVPLDDSSAGTRDSSDFSALGPNGRPARPSGR
jgi:sensor histidine kinase YesM